MPLFTRSALAALFATAILSALSLASLALTRSASSDLKPSSKRLFDPVIYADVAVECTIKGVHTRTVTEDELGLPSRPWADRKVNLNVAELSDVVVLRGPVAPTEVFVTVIDPHALIGQHLILCGNWAPRLKMFGVSDQTLFRREGDRWVDMRSAAGIPAEARASMTTPEITTLINENSIPTLSGEADLVLVGRISSVVDSTLAAPDQRAYRVRKVVLKVERVLKGDVRSQSTWFVAARPDNPPPWFTETPQSFGVGETWIAFLRRDGALYYPLGGVNGLLQLDGQKVIFNRKLPCRFSRDELTRTVLEGRSE